MAKLRAYSWVQGTALLICAFLGLQTLIVILHEHVHSTTAWLLGYSKTPFTVVWGNPVTMTGWDEGVPSDRLFPHGGVPAESAIGAAPLLMHALFLVIGLALLSSLAGRKHPRLFLSLYVFAVINIGELVAYFLMRPFILTGDTGRFNAGLTISPAFLFIGGNVGLLCAMAVLALTVGPRLKAILNDDERAWWALVLASGLIMFVWDSGIRMIYLYPDPQWLTGLIGLPLLVGWLAANALGVQRAATR
jgi:hypothetical protein